MEHSNRWKAAALPLVAAVALILGLSSCTQGEALGAGEEEVTSEATVEPVEGTELSKVTLTQRAAERLGIQTAQVRDAPVAAGKGKGAARKVIPYSAVLYDEQGDTWTFTSPQPLTYVRQKIGLELHPRGQGVARGRPARRHDGGDGWRARAARCRARSRRVAVAGPGRPRRRHPA